MAIDVHTKYHKKHKKKNVTVATAIKTDQKSIHETKKKLRDGVYRKSTPPDNFNVMIFFFSFRLYLEEIKTTVDNPLYA